jgi:23S rRNA (uracil1939-C5)-methyltransferase
VTDAETFTTTGLASNGHALARTSDGKVVFVDGALPGETVRVTLVSDRRDYSTARVVEVIDPSADRRDPPCREIERGCGGCQWQHVNLPAQHRLKSEMIAETLRRVGKLDPPVVGETVGLSEWNYRTSIRAGVTNGHAGLRRARSNQLVPVDECMVAHPRLAELLVGRRFGTAREVVLRCGARTGERMAHTTPAGAKIRVPADVRRGYFHEEAAGQRWRVSARSFFQSRPDGVDALAELVGAAAAEMGTPGVALDLYGGVGIFAGVLSRRGWSVTSVEGSISAVEDATVNLVDLDVQVVRADVSKWTPTSADLVVADPSRAGLGRDAVDTVVSSRARRVVLVSCDVASLARDASLLASAGYRLVSMTPVDMFPHTFHVEVVAVFDLPR